MSFPNPYVDTTYKSSAFRPYGIDLAGDHTWEFESSNHHRTGLVLSVSCSREIIPNSGCLTSDKTMQKLDQ